MPHQLPTEYSIIGNIYESNRTIFCIKDVGETYYFVHNGKLGLSDREFFINLNITNDHVLRTKIAKIFISLNTDFDNVHEDKGDDITFITNFCSELNFQEILFEDWNYEFVENIPSFSDNDCHIELQITC